MLVVVAQKCIKTSSNLDFLRLRFMGEVVEAILKTIRIVADNPSSILIVLGFVAVLLSIFVPIGIILQFLLGVLGLAMMGIGVYAHFKWLER